MAMGNALALGIQQPQINTVANYQASNANAQQMKSTRMQQEAAQFQQYAELGLGVMDGNPDGPINQDSFNQMLDMIGDTPLAAKLKENPELLRTITKGSLNVLAATRDEGRYQMETKKFEVDLANAQKPPMSAINGQLVNTDTGEVKGDYRDKPKEPDPLVVNNQIVDPNTKKVLGDYRDPAKAEGPDAKDLFGNEKDLYQQYSNSDPVKTYEVVKTSFERLQESAAQQSGAGDMGMIYAYMKMLDPGSVVRESEFAMAAQAGDFGEQVQGMVSRLLSGERLPESQRQEFLKNAEGLYKGSAQNLADINAQFEERAKGAGVDPKRFIRPPEEYKPIGGGGGDGAPGERTTPNGIPYSVGE